VLCGAVDSVFSLSFENSVAAMYTALRCHRAGVC